MPTYYYHAWTSEEEKKLSEIMKSGLSERKKTGALFREASVKLNRSKFSCMNRWYDIKNRTEAV